MVIHHGPSAGVVVALSAVPCAAIMAIRGDWLMLTGFLVIAGGGVAMAIRPRPRVWHRLIFVILALGAFVAAWLLDS
jgi:hypothetical protein